MLEMIQDAPLVSLGLLVVGLVLGLVAGNFALPSVRRARRLQTEIETLRGEQERYQYQVTEHFQTTAVLLGDLTSSYKAVYEHLASGARSLSDPALSAHGFGVPRLIVDGVEPDRLPQEPIAHDTDPLAAPVPSAPPDAGTPAGESDDAASATSTAVGTASRQGGDAGVAPPSRE